jgi:hypothetical protein
MNDAFAHAGGFDARLKVTVGPPRGWPFTVKATVVEPSSSLDSVVCENSSRATRRSIRGALDRCGSLSNEAGDALKTFKKAWVVAVLNAHRIDPSLAQGRLQGPVNGLLAAVSRHQPALARPEARVRLQAGRARRSARPGPRSTRSRVTRRSSRPSATTISQWRRGTQQLNGWKQEDGRTRRSMPRRTLWLLVNCKNGVSSCEIARSIGIMRKTAWFMGHRRASRYITVRSIS